MSERAIYEGSEADRRILTRSCVRCGAKPGEKCRTKTGRRATGLHMLRFYSAVRAGLLPVIYKDGEPT